MSDEGIATKMTYDSMTKYNGHVYSELIMSPHGPCNGLLLFLKNNKIQSLMMLYFDAPMVKIGKNIYV